MKQVTAILLVVLSLFSLSGGYRNRPVEPVSVEQTPSPVEETTVSVEQTVVPVVETVVSVEETVEEVIQPKEYEVNVTDQIALAQTAYGEYFLTDTPAHKMYCAAVMWVCCWHSLRGTAYGFPSTIAECCAVPGHFLGYNSANPLTDELMEMAADVLIRFYRYRDGETLEEVGCVLPPEYIFFSGNGTINVFRDQYVGGRYWDWSLPNPYEA